MNARQQPVHMEDLARRRATYKTKFRAASYDRNVKNDIHARRDAYAQAKRDRSSSRFLVRAPAAARDKVSPLGRRQAMFKAQPGAAKAPTSPSAVHDRRTKVANLNRARTFPNLVAEAVQAALSNGTAGSATSRPVCMELRHTDTLLQGELFRRAPSAPFPNVLGRPEVFVAPPCLVDASRGFRFRVVVACTEGQVFTGVLAVRNFMKEVPFATLLYETFKPSEGRSPFPAQNGVATVKTVFGKQLAAEMTVRQAFEAVPPLSDAIYVQLAHGIPLPFDANFPDVPPPSREEEGDSDGGGDADAGSGGAGSGAGSGAGGGGTSGTGETFDDAYAME